MPKRIQLSRKKGVRKPKGAVTVARPTKWGNPFTVGCEAWRFSISVPFPNPSMIGEVLDDYRYYAESWLWLNPDWLRPLKGKDLACWCKLCDKHREGKPLDEECPDCAPCHIDIIADILIRA